MKKAVAILASLVMFSLTCSAGIGLARRLPLLAVGLLLPTFVALALAQQLPLVEANPPSIRQVNAPYDVDVSEYAIFWFGQLTETTNYANVRVGYDSDELILYAHVFDRQLWYDTSPTTAELTAWDAVTLYVNTNGNAGTVPTSASYQFVAQFNPPQHPRDPYQAAYQGNGSGWASSTVAFTTDAGYRGSGYNNGDEVRGWWVQFSIPFANLGLASPPAAGDNWGLALTIHDRDDEGGSPIPDQVWPETLDGLSPSTWAEFQYGLPGYSPGLVAPLGTITVRHGVEGAIVPDAHVGGHSVCGDGALWSEWGTKNYAGYHQVNIQNQWDVADWPCYSKYYLTFPLGTLPAGQVIASATVTLYQFGSAGQGLTPPPEPSLVQALTVAEDWDEATINWNNAPLAAGEAGRSWVTPNAEPIGWPGRPIQWNVTRAVAEAYAAGQPLRLAFYSADLAYHSGKYFYSSDAGEAGRPILRVTWGQPVEPVASSYLPLVLTP